MPRLDLIIGMVSLTLCCYSAVPSDKAMCAKPPKIDNAILLGNWDEETYPHGQMAFYSCDLGYFNGRSKMVCVDGKWESLYNRQCKKKSCGHPGDTPFGTFELIEGDELVFGAVVEYTCDEGYQMVSKHKTRVCSDIGWTNEPPHCEARLCPPVRDDSVRVLSYVNDDEYTIGQVINFECKNPNYKLNGPNQIYCTGNGTWNVDPPTCKGACTVQENDMRINNIQLKNNHIVHYEDNETVQFECVSGYQISDPTKLQTQCESSILKYPTCHKKVIVDQYRVNAKKRLSVNLQCGKPPQIPHGEITTPLRAIYRPGSSVQYSCPSFFTIEGFKKIHCVGGMWGNPPICLEPCTTSDTKMNEHHIMLLWDKNKKNRCVKDVQKEKLAKKCYAKHNQSIRFTCLPGYNISNSKDLTSKCNRGIISYPTCFQGK
ncbi:complement factor H-like [Bufo bufo]|uniref:complement factor H-like n=1 Tax=Bufo bufo TaxID=8384 RepID=UPI001ABED361|nr:complement factor H-like [Bufo bufo]